MPSGGRRAADLPELQLRLQQARHLGMGSQTHLAQMCQLSFPLIELLGEPGWNGLAKSAKKPRWSEYDQLLAGELTDPLLQESRNITRELGDLLLILARTRGVAVPVLAGPRRGPAVLRFEEFELQPALLDDVKPIASVDVALEETCAPAVGDAEPSGGRLAQCSSPRKTVSSRKSSKELVGTEAA